VNAFKTVALGSGGSNVATSYWTGTWLALLGVARFLMVEVTTVPLSARIGIASTGARPERDRIHLECDPALPSYPVLNRAESGCRAAVLKLT